MRAAESAYCGTSIYAHDPKGKVAEAYRNLTRKVMKDTAESIAKHGVLVPAIVRPREEGDMSLYPDIAGKEPVK